MGAGQLEPIVGVSPRAMTEAVLAAARAAGIAVSVSMLDDASIVYVNEAAARIVGVPVSELLHRNALDFVAPEERPRIEAMIAARRAGHPAPTVYEVVLARPDGTRVAVQIARSEVTIEGRRATIAFYQDISARRATEDSLRKSELQLRRIVEHAPDGIGLVRDGRFLFVNAALARLLGHASADELVHTSWTAQVHADDAARFRVGAEATLARGEPLPAAEFRVKRADGEDIIVEVTGIPVDWDGGPALLGFVRDVTSQRRMQAQLVQSDRLAALGALAAGIAHEMNNPLAYALLQLEVLERQRSGGAHLVPEEIDARVASAREGLERVAATVRELRAFARTDDDTRTPVDVAHAIQSAVRIASSSLTGRGSLVLDLDEVPAVLASEARLEQVFLNLLVNAAQALPEATSERNEIRVRARAVLASGVVVVEIRDNGAGMAPDTLRRIFDPFFTTKPPGIGTGLGLSICHGIVASLGGTIDAESVPGYGTTFRVTLPAHPHRVPNSPTPPASKAGVETRRLRVLIIDDEPGLALTLSKLLESTHDPVCVPSARAAIERLETLSDFDVIVCDLTMPEMTGMELFDLVATRWPGLEKRFVFMTGGAFTEAASRFLGRVDNPRVEKPFGIDELERAMLKVADA